MRQLESVNKNTYNCFQFLVATSAKFYDCDYRLTMLELWGFLYEKEANETIGDRLKLYWNYKTDRRKQLLNKHGLTFDITSANAFDTAELICDKPSNSLIAVYIDSFVCPWIPFYQKIHRPHALFLTDKVSENFVYLDQYSESSENNEIAVEFVKNHATSKIIFKPIEIRKYNVGDLLLENLTNWKKYGFSHYETFISDMKDALDLSKEIVDDPLASKLIMFIKNLAEDRINFIECIDFIEEISYIGLKTIKKCLIDIASRYEKLRAYIIKCAYSGRGHKIEIISNELDNIYSQEKKIYEEIHSILK